MITSKEAPDFANLEKAQTMSLRDVPKFVLGVVSKYQAGRVMRRHLRSLQPLLSSQPLVHTRLAAPGSKQTMITKPGPRKRPLTHQHLREAAVGKQRVLRAFAGPILTADAQLLLDAEDGREGTGRQRAFGRF